MTTSRTEKVYVLFGSQTGNSEEYAKTFADELPDKLSPAAIQKLTGNSDVEITLQPKTMQLDDFLEIQKADWTRLVVIFVSSYGVGQAPLGCYRFRDLCDAWKDRNAANVLDGVHYALCGLGDSSYTTFFENPTKLDQAMTQVGATRVGTLAKVDAQGTGDDAQAPVMERWKEGLWKSLAEVVVTTPPSPEQLQQMQQTTIELCLEINPEFEMPETATSTEASSNKGGKTDLMTMLIVPLVLALVAQVVYYFYSTQ
ncbi:P450 reductase [Seminavis robusta]|uniref:P450 reductase n=1 Tax=Seminavis robusta TaxID=568900 RepID=A0A9N8EQ94_9STRA|nr:P450 reductase [Seminavis robusta]|eukprot:Sro1653_g288830.1 P450 reductase (256) ;mRNA; f:11259-12026